MIKKSNSTSKKVSVTYTWDETGITNYDASFSSSQEINVPENIIRKGKKAIENYVVSKLSFEWEEVLHESTGDIGTKENRPIRDNISIQFQIN